MNNNFAKLIQIDENNQVLIIKDYEDGVFNTKKTTEINGIQCTATGTFDSVEERDLSFDNYDLELAVVFYNGVKGMIEGPQNEH